MSCHVCSSSRPCGYVTKLRIHGGGHIYDTSFATAAEVLAGWLAHLWRLPLAVRVSPLPMTITCSHRAILSRSTTQDISYRRPAPVGKQTGEGGEGGEGTGTRDGQCRAGRAWDSGRPWGNQRKYHRPSHGRYFLTTSHHNARMSPLWQPPNGCPPYRCQLELGSA